jgi:hypothetical protein
VRAVCYNLALPIDDPAEQVPYVIAGVPETGSQIVPTHIPQQLPVPSNDPGLQSALDEIDRVLASLQKYPLGG